MTKLIEQKVDFMDATFRNWDQSKRKMLKKVHVGSLFQVLDYALEQDWSEWRRIGCYRIIFFDSVFHPN